MLEFEIDLKNIKRYNKNSRGIMNKLERIREKIIEKYGDKTKVELVESPIPIYSTSKKGIIEPILQEVDAFEIGECVKITFEDYQTCHLSRCLFEMDRRIFKYNNLIITQRKNNLYIIKSK